MFLNKGIYNFNAGPTSRTFLQIVTDGDTAGWYTSDDSNTIIKNASNYVAGWGDKLTYAEGAEMVDQNHWFEISYWNTHQANWSQSGTSLYANGLSSGILSKLNFWQIGHIYKITVTLAYESGAGEIRPVNDNTHSSRFFGASGNGTFTYFIPCSNTTLYNYATTWAGNITAISIKEVPVNTLVQYNVPLGYLPLWSVNGVLFDGTNDFLKTAPMILNQPEAIYIVVKQNAWTAFDTIIDGYGIYANIQQFNVTPALRMYGGAGGSLVANGPQLGTYAIIKAFYNGVNSKLQVNTNNASVGSGGTFNASGLTLGARYSNDAFASMEAKELVVRKVIDSSQDELTIYNYFRDKYLLNFTYPSQLLDGNTVGWYVADKLETIGFATGSAVKAWTDILGSGHDLIQGTAINQPTWSAISGITFNGSNSRMATASFTFDQPEFIYMVVKQVSWTTNGTFFDGKTDLTGWLAQNVTTPNIRVYAGHYSSEDTELAVGTFGIIRVLFNGASSKLIVNTGTTITGDFGSANMGGFNLGSRNGSLYGNIQVKEIILRKIADSSIDESAIYNYLKVKYGL